MLRRGASIGLFDVDTEESQDPNRGGLFDMKDRIRQQMAKPKYDVAQFYKTFGFAQYVARHTLFEKVTLFVITLNALWIAVDSDYNKQSLLLNAHPVFQIAEHAFCIYFSFEWTMRFVAFKIKCNCLKDRWFLFDSILVGTMVGETWVMTAVMAFSGSASAGGVGNASILRMARLFRLTRMARMARLLRAMPELLILIQGMAAAMRSVFFALSLLMVISYLFAIAFTQLCDGMDCSEEFGSVLESMHYLFIKGALMDGIGDVTKLLKQNIPLLMVFYVYVLLASLTLMNMLIGIICKVVDAVAESEHEESTVSYVKEKIAKLMHASDSDGDLQISKDEFRKLFDDERALALLSDVGVDVVGLPDYADTIFEQEPNEEEEEESCQEKTLSFEDFMTVMLDLRSRNGATVKDMMDLRRHINFKFSIVEKRLTDLFSGKRMTRGPTFRQSVSRVSLPRGEYPASRPGDVSTKSLVEPAASLENSQRLQRLIDNSLNDLINLQQAVVSRLLEDNRCLQAELKTSLAKQAEFSNDANLNPLQSVRQAACEDAIAAQIDDPKEVAVVPSKFSRNLRVAFVEAQCKDSANKQANVGVQWC
mmetsp:Transcript_51211/g.101729  ORF Transcript_51211/g.101729 Transcript_51211/m.101729 type:complete len:593 (-) Transcript_51211:15-1793(-)